MARRTPKEDKVEKPKRTRRSDSPEMVLDLLSKYDEIILTAANLDDVMNELDDEDMTLAQLRAVTKSMMKGTKNFNELVTTFSESVKENVRSGAFRKAFLDRVDTLRNNHAEQMDAVIDGL